MLHVAVTAQEKAIGFQQRDVLEDDEAMVFINVHGRSGFHMNNVGMPLAIASLDRIGMVLDASVMEAYDGRYTTAGKTVYVLEARPEFFDGHEIVAGLNVASLLRSMPQSFNYFESQHGMETTRVNIYKALASPGTMSFGASSLSSGRLTELDKIIGVHRALSIWRGRHLGVES